jgi:hypothetical protein
VIGGLRSFQRPIPFHPAPSLRLGRTQDTVGRSIDVRMCSSCAPFEASEAFPAVKRVSQLVARWTTLAIVLKK